MQKRLRKVGLILLGIGLCLGIKAQRVIRGSYLQNGTPEAMTIKWRTDSLTDSKVWYGSDPMNLTLSMVEPQLGYDHTIRLTGLLPYTTYYYGVGSSGALLEGADSSHFFHTNPVAGSAQPIKIWGIGDFGRNNNPERWVRDAYSDYVRANRVADVWLWMGDNAYDSGTDAQYQTNVFDVYDSIFAFQPFWPTPGNHDYQSVNQNGFPATHTGPYYAIVEVPFQGEAGGLPSGGEMMYSFDYGNVHFVSLNSELGTWVTAPNSPMAQWLVADLRASQQPWKIVYFHQPPHTKGSHNSDNFWEVTIISMRNNFGPLLEQNGVDLVLSGHSHVYERSRLMYGFYDWSFNYNTSFELDHGGGGPSTGGAYRKSLSGPNPNRGTIYAVVGNSGSSMANPALNHPMMAYGWGCDTCVGSMIIDVHNDTLQVNYFSSSGLLMDEFAIIKNLTVSQADAHPLANTHITAWPNPFSHQLQIQTTLDKPAQLKVQLYDLRGNLLAVADFGNIGAGQSSIDLTQMVAGISAGTYLLGIQVNATVYHHKIIKVEP